MYRNTRKIINKKTYGFRCYDSAVYTESGKHITPLTLTRGEIVWHTKYNEPYIFLFIDNGVPKFADTEGRFYEHLLSSYFQNKATYGTAGQKDDPTRKFDNIFGGTVHKKLNAAYDEIVASASLKAA